MQDSSPQFGHLLTSLSCTELLQYLQFCIIYLRCNLNLCKIKNNIQNPSIFGGFFCCSKSFFCRKKSSFGTLNFFQAICVIIISMSRKIVVTSGKGGVGKTSVVANLGSQLAGFGKKVVLLDTDFGLNNLDVVLGVEDFVVYDVIDVIEGKCRISQALIQHDYQKNLFVMPSAHLYDKSDVFAQNLRQIVDRLAKSFDYVILDCPAGVEKGFARSVGAVDEAILVTTPHIPSIRDANKVFAMLKSYDMKNIMLIVNRVRGDMVLNEKMLSVEEIVSLFNIELLGVVPEDDEVSVSSSLGQILQNGNAEKAFYLMAQNMTVGTDYIFDCTKKYRGFLGGIKRILKKNL